MNECLKVELKKIVKIFAICAVLFLTLEFSLFNIKFWATQGNKEINAMDYLIEIGSGLECEKTFDINGERHSDTVVPSRFHVRDRQNAYLLFRGFDTHINNIFLDIDEERTHKTNFVLYMDDAANDNNYGLKCEETTIYSGFQRTKHFTLHTNGSSSWLKIYFTNHDAKIDIHTITLNPNVSFCFSFVRFFALLFVSMCVAVFRSKALVYEVKLFGCNKKRFFLLAGVCALCMMTFALVGNLIKPGVSIQYYVEHDFPAYEQYTELADSLLAGQVSLLREAPKSLANAKNPYDGRQRWDAVVINGKEHFEIDYAYYNGKYYSYFGVVPAILFFIPYKLVTGHSLHTWHIVTLLSILFCIVAFWFVWELCRKYFKRISFGVYILCCVFLIFSSSTVYLAYVGNTYSLPIISALDFGLVGLALWLRCSSEKGICLWQLFLGSLCIALILGCRPHLVLVFLLAIPIFWGETLEKRLFFSRKGMSNTVIVMLPFVAVGLILACYNHARFGSPFDFGANYNLTSNDMTHRGWDWARVPLGFFTYILQPFAVCARFPFIECNSRANNYLGFTYYEPIFGGIIWYNALVLITLFIPRFRSILKEKRLLLFAVLPLLLALVIMALDANVAGLTQRYASDFSWLFAISTVVMVLVFSEHIFAGMTAGVISLYQEILLASVSISVLLNLWSVFIIGRYFSLVDCRASAFFFIKDLVLFY